MLTMNGTFKDLIDKFGYPTVPYIGRYENMYELVNSNYEWLLKGMGEGIVITHATNDSIKNSSISKWKNGMEANSTNADMLDAILVELEADKENEMFGENTEKAIELINKLLEV